MITFDRQAETVRTYIIFHNTELNRDFLWVGEKSSPLYDKTFELTGTIGSNHHPVTFVFCTEIHYFFWKRQWIIATTDQSERCILTEHGPDDVKTDLFVKARMQEYNMSLLGHVPSPSN